VSWQRADATRHIKTAASLTVLLMLILSLDGEFIDSPTALFSCWLFDH
jgi:hypothetical protein